MLISYLDETGHSKDERQKFVGVAGLIAPQKRWRIFERKWKKTLNKFKIPYFHMKEFAHSTGVFTGWKGDEVRRRLLFGKLISIVVDIEPLPVGSIIQMVDFNRLTDQQKSYFPDPYYLCLQNCLGPMRGLIASGIALSPEEKIALVLSEQAEFRHRAFKLYDMLFQAYPFARQVNRPDFGDMKKLVPLQAADIVAYELYKEYERRLDRPMTRPRFGYAELRNIVARYGFYDDPFNYHTNETLNEYVSAVERRRRLREESR